jgi:tetratricopeptide (TPR) repeat protein
MMAGIDETLQAAVRHHESGRLVEAEQLYRQVLATWPREPNALHLLGLVALQAGRPEEAVRSITDAIRVRDSQPAYHHHLGQAYFALGRGADARSAFEQALRLEPGNAAARYHLGLIEQGAGNWPAARQHYEAALALRPDFVEARVNLGDVFRSQGQLQQAAEAYRMAVGLRDDCVEAQHNLGAALVDLERFDEAIEALQQALVLRPELAEAHYNLGRARKAIGQHQEARASFERASAARPDFSAACYALANLLQEQEDFDAAAAAYQSALRLDPSDPDATTNYGKLLHKLGRSEEALKLFDRAIALCPTAAEAHFSRALILLRDGHMAQGWQDYAWRWKLPKPPLEIPRGEMWDGKPLGEGTLLVQAEQGLGDTLQFIRYMRLLRSMARGVVARVQAPLVPLLRQSGFDVVGDDEPPPSFRAIVPLLDVPGMLGTDLTNIPADMPYLTADPNRTQRWQAALGTMEGFKIGIAWQGSPSHVANRVRSIPLAHFERLARVPNVALISLQKGAAVDGLAIATFPDLDAGGAFLDTAAIMTHLDLVITADTAVAHLAGALGVRVWVALATAADWRWLAGREDSPWYPTMRLFRQPRPRDWSSVFENMSSQLTSH